MHTVDFFGVVLLGFSQHLHDKRVLFEQGSGFLALVDVGRDNSLHFIVALLVIHLWHKSALERVHVDDTVDLVHVIDLLMQQVQVPGKDLLNAPHAVVLRRHICNTAICAFTRWLGPVLFGQSVSDSFDELSSEDFGIRHDFLVLFSLVHGTQDLLIYTTWLLVKAVDVELAVDVGHDEAPRRPSTADFIDLLGLGLHDALEVAPRARHLPHPLVQLEFVDGPNFGLFRRRSHRVLRQAVFEQDALLAKRLPWHQSGDLVVHLVVLALVVLADALFRFI